MTIIAIGIIIAILMLGYFTVREIRKFKKGDKKIEANVKEAIRWRNYGHPFEVIDLLDKGRANVILPTGCLMEYEIKEVDGEWKMIVFVTDSLNSEKSAQVQTSLEYFQTNSTKESYKYITYYDEHNGLFGSQSVEKVIRDVIYGLPKRAVEKYNKKYPFEFSKLERNGVL